MRTLLLIATLNFTLTSSFGQDPLDSILSNDVCTCINQTKILEDNDFLNCFQIAMGKNSESILKACLTQYNDTSYLTAYKFGKELYERISVSMIYNCKAYYNLMDTLRYSGFLGFNKDSIKSVIVDITKTDPKTWDTDFFTQRGVMYFHVSDFDNALKDFDNAIKLNQYALQSIYFKAWTLELTKNYDEAFALYSMLATITKKNEFQLLGAIAKQKKNGL